MSSWRSHEPVSWALDCEGGRFLRGDALVGGMASATACLNEVQVKLQESFSFKIWKSISLFSWICSAFQIITWLGRSGTGLFKPLGGDELVDGGGVFVGVVASAAPSTTCFYRIQASTLFQKVHGQILYRSEMYLIKTYPISTCLGGSGSIRCFKDSTKSRKISSSKGFFLAGLWTLWS